MTVRSPAAPVGTLADIRARFVAGNSVFTDRPDLGNGAFEAQSKPPAGVVTLACDVFMTAPNGNTTQISVTYAQGPADDVCGYAEEIAGLVH